MSSKKNLLKKLISVSLCAAFAVPMMMPVVSVSAETVDDFNQFGVIGGFNNWASDIAEMTDEDGDGVYEAVVEGVDAGTYDFKVRADGAWDYSWGVYEAEYDRTQNSQTNCNVTLEEGQKLIVRLDTTKVDDAAKENEESYVNDEGFNFDEDGFDFWPVTFEVVDDPQTRPFQTLGVIGGFNTWASDIAEMTDEDGDGVYEAVVEGVDAGTYDFKVRADGAWDYSWGVYEAEYDRTQNSQTNCNVTLEEGQKLIVRLDTTKVDDAAKENEESYVNDEGFNFKQEGYDFWPVTFEVVDDTQTRPFQTLGVIGGFNSWASDIAEMTDEDGDGVYEAVVEGVDAGTYDFKVRADGAWDYSWGVYEADYDRTQNSQTNCSVTLEEGQKLVVKLDTTKVDDAAKENAESAVNEEGFNFNEDGFEYWPVTFEVVDDTQKIPFTTLGVIGGFNSWASDIAEMTDEDGDGVYEAVVEGVDAGTYDFKVRADGAWDYSWGVYEAEYDRTQNSQTNCNVTLEEGQKLVVKLDTTKVDDAAKENAESAVNEEGFNFNEDGFEYWPVTFEVEGGKEDNVYTTQTTDYIFFDNSKTKWDQVYAYWWDTSYGRTYDLEDNDFGWEIEKDAEGNIKYGEDGVTPNHVPTKFPGTKMTQVPGTDIWQIRIPFGAQKMIFGSGKTDEQIQSGEKGYQTQDLNFDPVANGGQIYSFAITAATLEEQETTDYKKGRGVEKTKYVAKDAGTWADYSGEYVSEKIVTKTPEEEVPVESITFKKTEMTIKVGSEYTMKTTVKPENADKTLEWSTSNAKVATVDNDGKVKGIAPGKCTITAKSSNGVSASYTLTVKQPVTSVTMSRSTLVLGKGEEFKLSATIAPANASDKTLKWYTSKKKIATVDQNGVVKAVATGTVSVYAKSGNNKIAECVLTVKKAPKKLKLTKKTLTLGVGEKFTLGSAISADCAASKRTYSSSDNSVVALTRTDWQGDLVAKKPGTAVITVELYNGTKAQCKVTVKEAPKTAKLSKGTLSLGVGEEYELSSIIDASAGASKRTFRTSNSSIVKMTKTDWTGKFKALKPGVAYVTVKLYNGVEAACKVTVKKAPEKVSLNKGVLTLKVGKTYTLNSIIPDGTAAATRTFRTSNSKVLKMKQTDWVGKFKAVSEGVAYITVRLYNGKEASCKVTVVKK